MQPASSQLPSPVWHFLNSCLWEKGIKDIPDSLRENMINQLAEKFQQWLTQSLIEAIPDSASDLADAFFEDEPADEEVQPFLMAVVPNFTQVVEASMVKFKQAYLGK